MSDGPRQNLTPTLETTAFQEIYRSVVRAMSEGVVIHDASGTILTANPSAEKILGLTLAQMTGRSPLDPRWRLVLPDGSPASGEHIPSVTTQRTGEPCRNVILGVHRPAGELAWLSINTDTVPDEETGRPRLVVATFTDITAEVLAKEELERSRAHYERLINAAPGVVYQYRVDRHGAHSFPFTSARVKEMLGLSPEALQRDAGLVWSRIHPDDVAAMRVSIEASARTLEPWQHEFRISPAGNDVYRWLRAHSIPERSDDGTTWTGVILDVTQEHQMAERLRRAGRREAMGDLAAGVAHNFNNMLASIGPNLELALEEATPRSAPLLNDALQAARSAADLVRQLMAIARNEALEPAATAVDVTELVRETLRFCRRTFDRRLELVDRLPNEPVTVWASASDLRQLVMNLCLNARDAIEPKEHGQITVTLARREATAILQVADDGIGMSDETLTRLGEPFFTTKPPGRGTGLGLASVYGIARDAGGQVTCRSAPGRGSTFEVQLPIHVAATPKEAVTHVAPARAKGRHGRVLVVDDEPLVRSVIGRMLEAQGFEVTLASHGAEALAWLETGAASLRAMIMDLSMPVMSGGELLDVVHARWPKLPVIVLTGHPDARQPLVGAAQVLGKPVGPADLAGALEAVLGPGD